MLRKTYPLDQSPLYRLKSRKRLAVTVLHTELKSLQRLADAERKKRYGIFQLQQGEKTRQVEAPRRALEVVHRRLFELFARIEKPEYLHSGRKGRSYVTNASAHLGHTPLVKLDVRKFYPSVSGAMVYRAFTEIFQCSPDVAGLLTALCTVDDHIPTGSCVSQLLAFYAAKPMLDELQALANEHGLTMTCYVDDLTFSGSGATRGFLWQAMRVVHRHGLRYHKARVFRASQAKVVTGVMLDGDRTRVIPGREHAFHRDTQALVAESDLEVRAAKLKSLVGVAVAASQLDPRFSARAQRLGALERRDEETRARDMPF